MIGQKWKWEGEILNDRFEGWYGGRLVIEHKVILCILSWDIWIRINDMISHDREILSV
jgi:hypothetical protein